jgi:hypothetical protein
MPRRVEFTRRSWLLSTIFDGIRDFADAGEWPTTKNATPILEKGVRTLFSAQSGIEEGQGKRVLTPFSRFSAPPPTVLVSGLTRFRFYFTPELLVGDAARFLDLAS